MVYDRFATFEQRLPAQHHPFEIVQGKKTLRSRGTLRVGFSKNNLDSRPRASFALAKVEFVRFVFFTAAARL